MISLDRSRTRWPEPPAADRMNEIQVIASALVWALVAAIRHWHAGGYASPLEEEFERALTLVERGLRLDGPVPPSPSPGGATAS